MDCSSLRKGADFPFSDNLALFDYNRPVEYQKGLMNCFCDNLYQTQGFYGSGHLFPDGLRYCKEWLIYSYIYYYQNIGLAFFISITNYSMMIIVDCK